MKNDYSFWINKWNKSNNFRVENNLIKPKSYLFSSFPKTNLYGFQDGNLRPVLIGDFFSRYQRMTGYNVLYPVGFDSLGLTSFMENKKRSNIINDDISLIFEDQMLKLGVGIDQQKKIDLKHDNYLSALQLAFIDLYERGYIKYDDIFVYQNKKKIYDSYFKSDMLSPNKIKAFYLDISTVKNEIKNKLNELNVSKQVKQSLFNMLEPKEQMLIKLATTSGASLEVCLTEPEYMGGISYICLHPDYIDFYKYVLYEEFGAIEDYLADDGNNDFGVFTGSYAINPLTGKKVPIFVSVKYSVPIYVANPFLNKEDQITADEECIPYTFVVQNDVFIESDFLNGLPVSKGREILVDSFLEADICTMSSYYSREKILLYSYDSFGALIPFLEDQDNNIYSLKDYLPFTFSAKFRPILAEDVDVPGEIISGSINHIFSSGMLPILSMLYDDIGTVISIFSKEAINIYNSWNGIDLMTVNEYELFENIFVPSCILAIIEKEKKVPLPPLFKELIVTSKIFDSNNLLINRENNNLFQIDKYLNEFHGDALRFYFLSKPFNEDFIFEEVELESIFNLIKAIENYYYKPFDNSLNSNKKLREFVVNLNELLYERKVDKYVTEIIKFFKSVIWKIKLNSEDALIFLKLLYPILPFLTEDIYHNVFKGRYLISDDGWV